MKTDLIEQDDILIDKLINQTNKLKQMTQNLWDFFDNTHTEKVEDRLVKDVCSVMFETYAEINATLYRKIKEIEDSIKGTPDLTPFDLFGVKVKNFISNKQPKTFDNG